MYERTKSATNGERAQSVRLHNCAGASTESTIDARYLRAAITARYTVASTRTIGESEVIRARNINYSEIVVRIKGTMSENCKDLDEEKRWLCQAIEERSKKIRAYRVQLEEVQILRREWEKLEKIEVPEIKATNPGITDYTTVLYQATRADIPNAMCGNVIRLEDPENGKVTKVTVIVAIEEQLRGTDRGKPVTINFEYDGISVLGSVDAPWAKQPFEVSPFPDSGKAPASTSRSKTSPRSTAQEQTHVEEKIGSTGIEMISDAETTESNASETSEKAITYTNIKPMEEFPILRRALSEKQDDNKARPVITEVRPVTPGAGLDILKIWERKKRGLRKNAHPCKEELSGEVDAENKEKTVIKRGRKQSQKRTSRRTSKASLAGNCQRANKTPNTANSVAVSVEGKLQPTSQPASYDANNSAKDILAFQGQM